VPNSLSVLEVHLDRVRRNYLSLQKRLARGAGCAAVVKADAYGLGAQQVAPALYAENCRHFYVAHAAEGVAVRAALAAAETKEQPAHIYAFHGAHGVTPEEMLAHGIVPVLGSLEGIEAWSAFARQKERKLPAVIHIDTGMNRLGLSAADVARLRGGADIFRPLDVRYVMSHLACADEPAHPKNGEQLEKFKTLTQQLGLPCRLSLANSSGIFLGADYHFDQARPGCSIYGINPQPGTENPMQRTVTLKARILQIREAAAGETIGYGAGYGVSSPARLATISAGYADGILRSFGPRGAVWVAGQKCPLAGRVSMDLIVADVTAVKGVKAGDEAELLGPHQTADDLAAAAGTIGYEVLTSLGKRYKRVYTTS
jgi:alanine racemase